MATFQEPNRGIMSLDCLNLSFNHDLDDILNNGDEINDLAYANTTELKRFVCFLFRLTLQVQKDQRRTAVSFQDKFFSKKRH